MRARETTARGVYAICVMCKPYIGLLECVHDTDRDRDSLNLAPHPICYWLPDKRFAGSQSCESFANMAPIRQRLAVNNVEKLHPYKK
jgi:hypothetical protein